MNGGSVSPDGRTSPGAAADANVAAWPPLRETCLEWPVTFTDSMALQGAMQARFDERLTSPHAGPVIVMLAPALHAKMAFDAITQEHAWGLADMAWRWIGITLPHDEAQAIIAARLRRISQLSGVHLVLAEVHVAQPGFALLPIAVVARMPSVGKAGLAGPAGAQA